MDKNSTQPTCILGFMKGAARIFWLLLVLIVLYGCSEDDPLPADPLVEDEFFVSSEELLTLSVSEIQTVMQLTGFGEFVELVENGFTVHRVVYNTTFREADITASGLVVIPDGITGPFPLLSAHHGTIFSHDEAPSEFSLSNGLTGFELFSAAGFVSIIPDYLGYGESKEILHPYYNFRYTASAILDMISATREFLDNQAVSFNDKLFLVGYSEGGYATLAAQKAIEDNPDSGFNITAAAAGAGGYDIVGVMDEVLKNDTYSTPAYLAFITYAAIQTNQWTVPVTDFFQEPFATAIPGLLDGSLTQSGVNEGLTTDLNALFNTGLLAELRNGVPNQLSDEFALNSVDDWSPVSTLRLYHSPADEIIPISTSITTVQKMTDNGGADVAFVEIGGDSHGSALIPMLEEVVPWFISLR